MDIPCSWCLLILTCLQTILQITADGDCLNSMNSTTLLPLYKIRECLPAANLDTITSSTCNCSRSLPVFNICPPPPVPELPDACVSTNPCRNSATCIRQRNNLGYLCQCAPGWRGHYCSIYDEWQWYDIARLAVIFTAIANVFILAIFFALFRHKPICLCRRKQLTSDDRDVAIEAYGNTRSIARGKTGRFKHTGSMASKSQTHMNGINNNEDHGSPERIQEDYDSQDMYCSLSGNNSSSSGSSSGSSSSSPEKFVGSISNEVRCSPDGSPERFQEISTNM